MAIEGPLRELKVEDVLQLLDLTRKTGMLTVRSEQLSDEALVHLERGAIVFATRRRSARRLGQQLLRAGKLTAGELERALEMQRCDPMRRLGEILLEMGSVAAEDLERHLRFQIEETIYDLLAWEEGYFRFEEVPIRAGARAAISIRIESLLMEGARRIDEWTRLEAKVPGPEAVPRLAAVDGAGEPITLRSEEWAVLAEIDGERDLRQIAADLGRSSFEVARVVYGLATVGLVEIESGPFRGPQPELDARIAEVERHLERGETEPAVRVATELQAGYPERAEVALLAGRALAAQGRMRAATEAFGRAVELDPLLAEAHLRLGFAATRVGELERAVRAWDTFLRLGADDPRHDVVRTALDAAGTLLSILSEGVEVTR